MSAPTEQENSPGYDNPDGGCTCGYCGKKYLELEAFEVGTPLCKKEKWLTFCNEEHYEDYLIHQDEAAARVYFAMAEVRAYYDYMQGVDNGIEKWNEDHCRMLIEKMEQATAHRADIALANACIKAHDRLVDAAGGDASTGDEAIFAAFWAALKPAVSQGTYDAISDEYHESKHSWRVLPMIASEWVAWL